MPHPLFLKVMDVSLAEYNSYSDDKKLRFQKAAQKKLIEVQSDPKSYTSLTNAAEQPVDSVEPVSNWEEKENV